MRRTYSILSIVRRHGAWFQRLHKLMVIVTGMPDSMHTKEHRHG